MSYKLYADDRCVEEIFSPNDLREQKICNCPNCGAPITSYICEYCGTEFEKPKKVLMDEEKRESFAGFVREQKLAQMKASQEWQARQLLNTLNAYSVQTQIANIRDSINTNMHQSQTNISPYQGPKTEEDDETVTNAEKLAHGINILVISLILFMIFVLSILAYHFSG